MERRYVRALKPTPLSYLYSARLGSFLNERQTGEIKGSLLAEGARKTSDTQAPATPSASGAAGQNLFLDQTEEHKL